MNDGGVALLASAGELAEAETVGGEVARLLHDGVPPGEIAIVLRDPGSAGPLYRRVLTRFGIPIAVQADLAATRDRDRRGADRAARCCCRGGGPRICSLTSALPEWPRPRGWTGSSAGCCAVASARPTRRWRPGSRRRQRAARLARGREASEPPGLAGAASRGGQAGALDRRVGDAAAGRRRGGGPCPRAACGRRDRAALCRAGGAGAAQLPRGRGRRGRPGLEVPMWRGRPRAGCG